MENINFVKYHIDVYKKVDDVLTFDHCEACQSIADVNIALAELLDDRIAVVYVCIDIVEIQH